MALHYMKLRCEWGHERLIRRPNNTLLISKIVARSKCYLCHPEVLGEMCGGCLIPFSVVPHHSNGMCGTCVRREHYRNLSPERVAIIRAEEMLRSRERRALQTARGC